MNLPHDAAVRLEAFLELMRRFAGFEIEAEVRPRSFTPNSGGPLEILVHFSGSDEPLLVANQGELLIAMESLAADFLELEGKERHQLRFESEHFRVEREGAMVVADVPA